MTQFNVTAEFALTTEVEADGITFSEIENEVEGYEDVSYFQSASVESSGGELRFVLDADNADDATAEAERLVYDGMEVTDYNGLTWLLDSVYVNVEEVEVEMTLDSAIATVTAALEASGLNAETQEALRFLLALIPRN